MFRFKSFTLSALGAVLLLSSGAVMADDSAAKPLVPAANPIANTSPFIKPMPDVKIVHRKTELVSVKMLSSRPSGAGGVQPFSVRDVRNKVDPERIMMLAARGCTGVSSPQDSDVVFILPAAGNCSLVPGSVGTGNPDAIFSIGNFDVSTATLTPLNGWTAMPTIINSSDTGSATTNITISKGGISYSMTLTTATDQPSLVSPPAEGTVAVSNFMRF